MIVLRILIYCIICALAWIFRTFYIGWFGPYLFWIVVSAPLFLFFLSLPSLLSVNISLSAPERVACHSEADFLLQFNSRRRLPVQKVSIRFEIYNIFNGEHYTRKYTYRQITDDVFSVSIPTELCGELRCRIASVTCYDLLGLFCIRKTFDSSFRCVVMPIPVVCSNPPQIESVLKSPSVFVPKYGGGFSEEHDLREYRSGDPINSIHWKLSSKTDTTIVREPLIPENDTVYVVLSRVGENDRGLEVLSWLSGQLLEYGVPHVIVSSVLHTVEEDSDRMNALAEILSIPMQEPRSINPQLARCIFLVSSGEVRCL